MFFRSIPVLTVLMIAASGAGTGCADRTSLGRLDPHEANDAGGGAGPGTGGAGAGAGGATDGTPDVAPAGTGGSGGSVEVPSGSVDAPVASVDAPSSGSVDASACPPGLTAPPGETCSTPVVDAKPPVVDAPVADLVPSSPDAANASGTVTGNSVPGGVEVKFCNRARLKGGESVVLTLEIGGIRMTAETGNCAPIRGKACPRISPAHHTARLRDGTRLAFEAPLTISAGGFKAIYADPPYVWDGREYDLTAVPSSGRCEDR